MIAEENCQPVKLHHGYTRKQLKAMISRDRFLQHPFFYPDITHTMRGCMMYWKVRLTAEDSKNTSAADHHECFRMYMKCRNHYKSFIVHWRQLGSKPLPLP